MDKKLITDTMQNYGADYKGFVDWLSGYMSSNTAEPSQWCYWDGGGIPIPDDTFVEVQLKSGNRYKGEAGGFRWSNQDEMGDIRAYRVIEL